MEYKAAAERQKFSINDFLIICKVEETTFGKLVIAKHVQTNLPTTIKILKKGQIVKANKVENVKNQYEIFDKIVHPFVMPFDGVSQDERNLYAKYPFKPSESMTYHIGKLDSAKTAFYAAQIVLLLEKLHSSKVIYRDLRPENLLIMEDGYINVREFTIAKVLENADDRTYTLCGIPRYMAPEVLANKGYGKSVDWWTLGIFIYECLVGSDPFEEETPMATYERIMKGKVRYPKDFDKDAKSLVKKLFIADPSKRYGNLKHGANAVSYTHLTLPTIYSV
eukprot:TRINITY_DN2083_c0_g1_i12.p1 TRINITY_DN2083_c0_g1~~TRINITY_DN2083_c0_g1_i12.p1  ORF type:complete len:279 (+),score=52.84 TRINITY_DN2083_c0_g1_i12:105-941(+)